MRDGFSSEEDVPSPPASTLNQNGIHVIHVFIAIRFLSFLASHKELPSIHQVMQPPTRLRSILDLPVLELPPNYRRVDDSDESLKPHPKVTGPLDRLFAGSAKSTGTRDPLPQPRPLTPEVEMHHVSGPAQLENHVRELSIIELNSPPPQSLRRLEVSRVRHSGMWIAHGLEDTDSCTRFTTASEEGYEGRASLLPSEEIETFDYRID